MESSFNQAIEHILQEIRKIDPTNSMRLDEDEILSNIEDMFFEKIVDQIDDKQTNEFLSLTTTELRHKFLILNTPNHISYLQDIVKELLQFYKEDFEEIQNTKN